ncbi:hypothetical protein X560_1506 [Listeria fleischmannii 1991]|uniref:Predicted integral membrane protein n=2 Tax=Listeria fleischmannii TaxID=1069827 RepID=A0A2X3G1E8_9LIST|nr:SdpI family protein [Listeria fleischmannii]EMG27097.1 hypothetical protein LFLEISCH_12835 [Listeria fleischmannii subsp. fleischmannii LU2006-1]KMT59952.1 hypothetical protein X560_1506 [Listeria fleischmannii 1991]SQC62372.1 Predicted integral membrane protein [Listeria fleischmannii subsp. fleischmannii]
MKKVGTFPSMIIFITVVASLACYPLLPAEIAVHFGSDFSPDMFMQKWLGLVLMPFLMIMFTGTEYYGKEKVKEESKLEFEYCFRLLLVLLAIIQLSIIAYGLGYEIPTGRFALITAGSFMLLVAAYLSYSKKVFLFLRMLGFKKVDAYSKNLWKKITIITLTVSGLSCLILAIFMRNDPSYFMMSMFLGLCIIVVGSGVYLNKK